MTQTEFEALTPEQKRIAIAEDVVRHIDAKQFKVEAQCRLELDREASRTVDRIDQQNVTKTMPHCSVCAKGAMLLARIERFGNCSIDVDTVTDEDDFFIKELTAYFDTKQLDLIEAAFEMTICSWHGERYGTLMPDPEDPDGEWFYDGDDYTLPPEEKSLFDNAIAFGERYEKDSARLRAIMQNLIAHQGTFIP